MTDTFTYTNRRGDTYYLQGGTRRNGGLAYSFSRKPSKSPLPHLPEGFEVYEHPESTQVFIRKIKPTPILLMEVEQVRHAVRHLAGLELFIVQVDGNSLVVYTTDMDPDNRVAALSAMFPIAQSQIQSFKDDMLRFARYTKMMRFTLIDPPQRLFRTERWCFRGSIDNWIPLMHDLASLSSLLDRYVPHLGKESFYELM